MVRLYLFAEGLTEAAYARDELRPHLAQRGVFIAGPLLVAHKRKKGKIHRGGGRSYGPMRDDLLRFLKQEKGPDVFFTTMIDLYALYADFPGRDEADKLRHDPYERVRRLEKAFAEDVNDARFIPYIQLHEFESLLFADPTAFEYAYADCGKHLASLQEIVEKHGSPELINDGQHTAPSKRIIALFADYHTDKPTAGPQLARVIGLDVIRAKCPHFNEWLTRLEALGGPPAP
jgi:hypothetical protein